MKTPHLLLPTSLFLLPLGLCAQGLHVHHAFENVCNGFMYYDEFVDSVVWSTGDVGTSLNDLPPGFYSFTAYQNGQVVDQGTREVELVGWNTFLVGDPFAYPGLFFLSGNASVPHCVSQIFTGLCCEPDPTQTQVLVFQDGVPYPTIDVSTLELDAEGECAGCTNVDCDYGLFLLLAPPGHVYTVGVNDPTCAGLVMADTSLIAYSCANLELVTSTTDASSGQADGSIVLVEAIPDPDEPYPIEAPVSGTVYLYQLPDGVLMGTYETATSAQWDGIPEGDYLLIFYPDAGCQIHSVELHVGTSTGTDDPEAAAGIRLFPSVADRSIYLASEREGPIHLRIIDQHGRVVVNERMSAGSFAVDGLPVGIYLVQAEQGGQVLRTRFVKR